MGSAVGSHSYRIHQRTQALAAASLSSGSYISVDENCFLYDFGHVYRGSTNYVFENLCCCLVKSSLFVLSIAFFLLYIFLVAVFVVLRCRNRKNTDVIFCGDEKCTGTSIWNVVDCSGILQVMDMVFIWMNNSTVPFFFFVFAKCPEAEMLLHVTSVEKRLLPVITVTFFL